MAVVTYVSGDRIKVRAHCIFRSQASVNTFDYVVASPPPVGAIDEVNLANLMSTAFAALYKPTLNAHAAYRGLSVQLIRGPVIGQQVYSGLGVGVGVAGREPMAPFTCGITTKFTDRAGRQFRGRVYWPFPYRSLTDINGQPDAIQVADYRALSDYILAPQTYVFAAESLILIPTLFHGPPKVGATPGPSMITGNRFNIKWAEQHRRGDYGQANTSPI